MYIFEPNPRFSIIESGSHEIKQIVFNQYGCPDTSRLFVKINPTTTIYVPNSFTPDGNIFNNEFLPVVYDVAFYEFYVYNRWGEQIYFTSDIKQGWNGTYNNKDLPDGTYHYRIVYRSYDSSENKEVNGHVNLIR
jgi:gliding motility-associated-like protein